MKGARDLTSQNIATSKSELVIVSNRTSPIPSPINLLSIWVEMMVLPLRKRANDIVCDCGGEAVAAWIDDTIVRLATFPH